MAKKLTQEQVLHSFIKMHGSRYDYSRVSYKDTDSKVEIICKGHGVFLQSSYCHKNGQGCPSCADNIKNNTEEFTSKARHVHGLRYNYSEVEYISTHKKVKITCEEHGAFMQSPAAHLIGKGCDVCGGTKRLRESDVIASFVEKHGDRYDYSLVKYATRKRKVEIVCCKHGVFKQSAEFHMWGGGCPSCAKSGFDPNKSATLYYLAVGDGAYKIGITNLTVERRYRASDLAVIRVISEINYAHGGDAQKAELKILREHKKDLLIGANLLSSGNTELFCRDVLALDD